MLKLHVTNSGGRNTTVSVKAPRPPTPHRLALSDGPVSFQRFLAAGEHGLDDALTEALGAEYGEALRDGDPEVDFEVVGRSVGPTDQVFLSSQGEVLYASPRIVEIIFDPDGSERERREPEEVAPTVDSELPARWTGRKIPQRDAVRRFAFRRTLQLMHVDGLTYDYLFGMAKELSDEGVMVRLGGGTSGKEPLILQHNGSPYQGFLEGRVQGDRYQLLLRLTNMELKRRRDAGLVDGPYSWWRARQKERALHSGWRIDYVLGNALAAAALRGSHTVAQAGQGISDHAPVSVDLELSAPVEGVVRPPYYDRNGVQVPHPDDA